MRRLCLSLQLYLRLCVLLILTISSIFVKKITTGARPRDPRGSPRITRTVQLYDDFVFLFRTFSIFKFHGTVQGPALRLRQPRPRCLASSLRATSARRLPQLIYYSAAPVFLRTTSDLLECLRSLRGVAPPV